MKKVANALVSLPVAVPWSFTRCEVKKGVIIEPTAFNLNLSLSLLLMVMVGGSGYFLGPFLGAAVSVLLPEWMRFGSEGLYLIFYAIAVMVLMAFCPTGLLGLAERARRLVR